MKKVLKSTLALLAASSLVGVSMVSNSQVYLADLAVMAQEESSINLYHTYAAPHGDKAFASVIVVTQNDVIVDVVLDEYQFMEGDEWEGVPNADGAFGESFSEGTVLISKLANDEAYSERMAEAGSTVSYGDNIQAIVDHAVGKTAEEVQETIETLADLGEDEAISDIVSGATLVDTGGYLQAIVDAFDSEIMVESDDVETAELKTDLAAPHGDKAFALVSVVLDGDIVETATLDEFQYLSAEEVEGLPNSDGGFGENYPEDQVLASKLANNEFYSERMAEAGSTIPYADNMQAIIDFASGKTIEEIESAINDLNNLGEDEEIADIVSGATFVDTAGYLQAIVDTANK